MVKKLIFCFLIYLMNQKDSNFPKKCVYICYSILNLVIGFNVEVKSSLCCPFLFITYLIKTN